MFLELNRALGYDTGHKNIFSRICFNTESISSISKDRADEDVCHIRIDGIWMAVSAKYEDLISLLDAISLEDALYIKDANKKWDNIEREDDTKPTKKKRVSKKE